MTFTRDVLYRLKKFPFAQQIDVYITTGGVSDLSTGLTYHSVEKVVVKQALVLPGHVSQVYKQLTSVLFRTGGEQNIESKVFVIDQKDISGYALKKTDYIVYLGKKYEPIDIDYTEVGESIMVLCKNLPNAKFMKVVDERIRSTPNATSSFTVVP